MAQFVSYSGAGNSPIYYQPTLFAPEPPYGSLYGYGMWQKVGSSGGQSNVEVKTPERSMVAEYLANRQPYIQFSAQPAPLQSLGYNPSMASLYTPSTTSLYSPSTSLLTNPIAGNNGAGRYLSNTGLLGFNFGLPSGQSANTQGTP